MFIYGYLFPLFVIGTTLYIFILGRYFYNVYIVKMFEIVFPLSLRTMIYFHVYIILDFL